MDRAIFKGNISLGPLLVPMRIVKATSSHDLPFHEYHADDMGRVGRSKPCKSCGKVLTEADIVKGMEPSKGTVLTFTKEELASLPVKSTKSIVIDRFVDAKELNPIMFDNAYYVLPDEKLGLQAFELLVKCLKLEKKVAIGKVALRQRENICAIAPHGNGLVLNTMHYEDEIRKMPQVEKGVAPDEDYADVVRKFMQKLTKPFDYSAYTDEYTSALQDLVDAKLDGKTISVTEEKQEVQSLEDALAAMASEITVVEC